MNKIIIIIVLILIIGAGAYFLLRGGYNVQAPSGPVSSGDKVTIKDFSFSPAVLDIKQGAVVTWVNEDSVPHSINSASFNSSALENGQSYEYKFAEKGTFDYTCGLHPYMKGQIIVSE